MNAQIVYAVSNSSMELYPSNTRARFCNHLSKEVFVQETGKNSLWLTLENLLTENTIVSYNKSDNLPDIIFNHSRRDKSKFFKMSKQNFRSNESVKDYLKVELGLLTEKFVGSSINNPGCFDIELFDGYFHLTCPQVFDICIHSKFFEFLGLSEYEHVIDKFWHENIKYYAISAQLENNCKVVKAKKKFNFRIFLPNLIQILCYNISPNLSGTGHDYIIGTFNIDHNINVLEYTSKSKKPFKINAEGISNVSFLLTDEHNTPIEFACGPPTIIKLNIFEMERNITNFYVKITNNDSINMFKDNTVSSFTTKLPKEISVDSRWEIALTSIYLPRKLYNIYKPMNIIDIEIIENYDSGSRKTVYITPGYYSSSNSLCNVFNNCLKECKIKLEINQSGHLFIVPLEENKQQMNIHLHKKMAGLLGVPEELLIKDNADHICLKFNSETLSDNTHIMLCKEMGNVNITEKI